MRRLAGLALLALALLALALDGSAFAKENTALGDGLVWSQSGTAIWTVKPPTALTIGDGEHSATVSWGDGVVRFSGGMPVDEAARKFLTAVGHLAIGCGK